MKPDGKEAEKSHREACRKMGILINDLKMEKMNCSTLSETNFQSIIFIITYFGVMVITPHCFKKIKKTKK